MRRVIIFHKLRYKWSASLLHSMQPYYKYEDVYAIDLDESSESKYVAREFGENR